MSPDFALQAHVDYLYQHQPRRLAFNATDLETFKVWQQTLQAEVVRLLGLTGRTLPANSAAEKLQAIDQGTYIEEKYALDVGDNVPAPMYVLVPKTPPPYKPVMVFHGHSPSVQHILGHYPDEQTAQERLSLDGNYAQALAQAGYLVCAVEQRGFGERITDQGDGRSCRHLSFEYLLEGRTLLGERCWDGMVAISYILGRDDVIPGALAGTGNSGGGTTTLWLSVIDERITVVIPASYLCSFKDSILSMNHCECNYVPGILELVEMGDLAAAIAPRPFRAIHGQNDTIYPVEATRAQFATVQRAYALWGVPERASLTVHPGPHAYNHAMSHEWLARWLAT
jgi:dienelactone hydrolase